MSRYESLLEAQADASLAPRSMLEPSSAELITDNSPCWYCEAGVEYLSVVEHAGWYDVVCEKCGKGAAVEKWDGVYEEMVRY